MYNIDVVKYIYYINKYNTNILYIYIVYLYILDIYLIYHKIYL